MSDQGTETVQTAETTETAGGNQAQEQTTTETVGTAEERISRMEAALKKANTEAAKYRKQAEAFEKAEQERKEAQLSETEKLQKRLAERENELHTLQTNELKRQAAAKHKLPDALALRLQGNTLEELEKDAEELVKTLPKGTVNMGATNPGATTGRKTDEELRAEIFGGGKALFTPGWLEQHGGGVFSVDKED